VNVSDRREPDRAGRGTIEDEHRPMPPDRQENPMLICVLDLHTAPADRPAALAQLDREHDEIRAMPGNLDFRVYAARDQEGDVLVVHEWADEPSFAAYLASPAFARSGEVIRPLMSEPAVSRRFQATLLETV
jgi:quinol monooxygenase YgiN